jgi:hypothetical protein
MVDIGQMPTSCADLHRMGQKISGFFLVKGAKKMEALYCNFYSNQNGTQSLPVWYIIWPRLPVINWLIPPNSFNCRQTKMDRIRRREISARPFLRPEKFFVRHN